MTVSSRDKVLLVILAVLGLAGGFYWFIVKPARADADARRTELQQVQDQTGILRDQLNRLQAAQKNATKSSGEAFRLAKAVPDGAQTPGAIVQLQRLADRANVDLSVLRTSSTTSMGGYQATQLEVDVTGRFFDVDDFMFRLHHQVSVNSKGTPNVDGRLFAVKSGQITLRDQGSGSGSSQGKDQVEAVLQVLVFSTGSTSSQTAAAGTTTATTGAATTSSGLPTSAVATAQNGVTTANAASAAAASSTGGSK